MICDRAEDLSLIIPVYRNEENIDSLTNFPVSKVIYLRQAHEMQTPLRRSRPQSSHPAGHAPAGR
jgi:hypothetical protein